MSKKLTETKGGDLKAQIKTILDILWAIKKEDKYYFFTYGEDIISTLVDQNQSKT